MLNWLEPQERKRLIILLFIVVSFSFSIVYTDVRTYNTDAIETTGYTDTAGYLNMYFGGRGYGTGAARPLVGNGPNK
jgi:hypothetical protein